LTVFRFLRALPLVSALVLAGCAQPNEPDEDSLRAAFADQIASSSFVADFQRNGGELTFTGPDGKGGRASWRVRIDSASLVPNDDPAAPFRGVITSSWYADGQLVEYLGRMSGLPEEFLQRGVAQECYALWDAEARQWGW